jgi:hypothetical protein
MLGIPVFTRLVPIRTNSGSGATPMARLAFISEQRAILARFLRRRDSHGWYMRCFS